MLKTLPRTQGDTRDIWLSWATGILACSAAVLVAADIFGIVAAFQNQELWGFQTNAICKLILDLSLIPAFGLSSIAFRSQAMTRAKMLRTGAILAAAGATIGLIGRVAAISAGIAHRYPTSYIVVLSIGAIASTCLIFAFLLASDAFAVRDGAAVDMLVQRHRQLMRASVGLAGSYALVMLSQLLLVRYLSGLGIGNTVTTGISMSAVGAGIAAVAGLIGAVGLYRRLQAQPQADGKWFLAGDRLLGVAAGAFAVAFLTMGLGMFAQATSGEAGGKFAGTAYWWISGVASIGSVVASMCATLGFLSRSWDVAKSGFLSRG